MTEVMQCSEAERLQSDQNSIVKPSSLSVYPRNGFEALQCAPMPVGQTEHVLRCDSSKDVFGVLSIVIGAVMEPGRSAACSPGRPSRSRTGISGKLGERLDSCPNAASVPGTSRRRF